MGVRAAVVVCVTSFLLGALFTHWIADSLTLWKSPVTDQNLWIAADYYSIIAKASPETLWALAAIVSLGGTTLLWSLVDWRAGNIMFDGGSIFLFATVVVKHTTGFFPDIFQFFSALPPHHALTDPVSRTLRNATLGLATNNLVCSVALTGVLALQAGRYWAEHTDSEEEEEEDEFVVVDAPASGSAAAAAAAPATSQSADASSARKTATSISEEKVKPLLQQRLQTA